MSEMEELLAKVKAATGSDRKENYDLNIEVGKALLGWYLHEHKAFGGYDTDWAEWRTPDEKQVRPMPDFVTSIDAALSLVERMLPGSKCGIDPIFFVEGEEVKIDAVICIPQWQEWTPVTSGWIERHEARHSHVPLAILAALLTALIAQEPK